MVVIFRVPLVVDGGAEIVFFLPVDEGIGDSLDYVLGTEVFGAVFVKDLAGVYDEDFMAGLGFRLVVKDNDARR